MEPHIYEQINNQILRLLLYFGGVVIATLSSALAYLWWTWRSESRERIEIDKPFCELRRFKRFTDDVHTLTMLKDQPVVLIVAPLSGHYATLLRDTVRTMLQGHKVYVTDWKNARLVPVSEGDFHLNDYVNYIQEFVRYLQDRYGNCHVMSVCQPTVPVLAAVSLMASRGETTPLSMTMMGGPIDARTTSTCRPIRFPDGSRTIAVSGIRPSSIASISVTCAQPSTRAVPRIESYPGGNLTPTASDRSR
jgi:hypothetical protein